MYFNQDNLEGGVGVGRPRSFILSTRIEGSKCETLPKKNGVRDSKERRRRTYLESDSSCRLSRLRLDLEINTGVHNG